MTYDLSALIHAFLWWSGAVAWTCVAACLLVEGLKLTKVGRQEKP